MKKFKYYLITIAIILLAIALFFGILCLFAWLVWDVCNSLFTFFGLKYQLNYWIVFVINTACLSGILYWMLKRVDIEVQNSIDRY